MNRPTVDPAFTLGLSLAVSLLLWYPTLRETMTGNIEITDAGIRYFLAFAISWAGVYSVSAIVAMCARRTHQPGLPPPPDPGARQGAPARRQDDVVAAELRSERSERSDSNAA
jgi:hypothetical protein